MADRDKIWNDNVSGWKLVMTDKGHKNALSAMDEYMKETCLELLEYMAKNIVICGHYSSSDGPLFKVYGHGLLTKEQLFENFL